MRSGARVTVLSPPRCNNMTVCHMLWIIFWSHSCGACASVVTRTDTIFDQDCGLKVCCVSMYTVTVVPLLTTSVDYYTPFLRRLHLSMQDSPAKSRNDPQKSKKTRLPPDSCLNNSVRAQTHAGREKSVRSFCHRRTSVGSKSFRQVRYPQIFALQVAVALLFALALLVAA